MDGGFNLGNSDGVDDDLIFQRIDSGDIVYSNPSAKYKLVGAYIFGNKIGEGSYAKVKECIHSLTLQRCAVKIMKQKTLRKIPHGAENVEREIKLLKTLKHNNVINLLDVHYNEEKGKIYMMMEYCVIGLQELLDTSPGNKFPIWQAHGYFCQLLEGLEYLHSRGVVHKDIKPGNLLLTCDHTLKITDFGVAERVSAEGGNDLITCSQGSPMFQPPEVAGGSHTQYPGYKLDIWSTGCTLYNITSGKYPFNGSNIFRIFESVCQQQLQVPPELGDTLTHLLEEMLVKDPFERICLQDIKKHKWVRERHPRDPQDEGISLWGRQGHSHVHSSSVIPFIQCHYYPDETQQYITERQINAGECGGTSMFDSSAVSRPASRNQRTNKRRKPTSCLTFKSLTSCSQS